jgi:hypothetical protein
MLEVVPISGGKRKATAPTFDFHFLRACAERKKDELNVATINESGACCDHGNIPLPKMWNRIRGYSDDANAGLEAGLRDLPNLIHAH